MNHCGKLILSNVLTTFVDTLSNVIRLVNIFHYVQLNNPCFLSISAEALEKTALFEHMESVLLIADELIDGG